jgi:hypothetical protein
MSEPCEGPPKAQSPLLLWAARLFPVLAGLSLLATGLAALLITVWEMSASRAFPLAFYIAGGLVALGGFFGLTVAASIDFPWPGEYYLRAENRAAFFGALSAGLLAVGVLLEFVL